MIRYRYVHHFTPPPPFVHVTLRWPATGQQAANLPAQIDTAADRTVLPPTVVQALGLVEDCRAYFQGFGGDNVQLPIFLVEVRIHTFPAILLRAVQAGGEPHILLGRDVLNLHHILLEGPQEAIEVERP